MSRHMAKGLMDELQGLAVFARCSRRELEALTHIGTVIRVEPGYTFVRQGSSGWELFVVMDGAARCLIDDVQVASYGAGQFFGEMSVIDHAPRSATVVADTAVTALVIDSRHFAVMLEEAPSTVRPILTAMSQRLRASGRGLTVELQRLEPA